MIFGEYFGGWYPHEGVNGQGVGVGQPVFKDTIAYSPCHHFYAFDVWVDGSSLDYDVAIDLLERAGFPFVAEPSASVAAKWPCRSLLRLCGQLSSVADCNMLSS